MDRDFLVDLFAPFGAVTIRRMFSGFGISADEITFALVIRDTLYFRVDGDNLSRFEAEGSQPFHYTTRQRTVTVKSYWRLPDRLLDEADELAEWARDALAAARRAALAKAAKKRRTSTAKATKRPGKAAKKAAKPKAGSAKPKPKADAKPPPKSAEPAAPRRIKKRR